MKFPICAGTDLFNRIQRAGCTDHILLFSIFDHTAYPFFDRIKCRRPYRAFPADLLRHSFIIHRFSDGGIITPISSAKGSISCSIVLTSFVERIPSRKRIFYPENNCAGFSAVPGYRPGYGSHPRERSAAHAGAQSVPANIPLKAPCAEQLHRSYTLLFQHTKGFYDHRCIIHLIDTCQREMKRF